MFSQRKQFRTVLCPDRQRCVRPVCLFSHARNAKPPPLPFIPTTANAGPSSAGSSSHTALPAADQPSHAKGALILAKRSEAPSPQRHHATPINLDSNQISRKRQRLEKCSECRRLNNDCDGKHPCQSCRSRGTTMSCTFTNPSLSISLQSNSVPSTPTSQSKGTSIHSRTSAGVPLLRINAANSQVAVPVRQAMVKLFYDTFTELYSNLSTHDSELAVDHCLAQEAEIYAKTNKYTYRNSAISCAASIKKRTKPTSISHDSVGTEEERRKRKEDADRMQSMTITSKDLNAHVLSLEDMQKWGYMTEVPSGAGGDRPSEEGNVMECERCKQQFKVKRREEADECIFHWGRPYSSRINGEKSRKYNCCGQSTSEAGCDRGPHVFYESQPDKLHSRHGFSLSRPPADVASDTALDVVALDCEMIYTTGGIRCARVSVVDGGGQNLLDEVVKLEEDVHVIDYNTRFSGITDVSYQGAVLTLRTIRRSLDALINSNTIIIGHALENDLKTLRMVHHRCVDTTTLFPHRSGAPFRKKLRDLAREYLGRTIQEETMQSGHSSLDDTLATLDLVKYFVLNKPRQNPPVASGSS